MRINRAIAAELRGKEKEIIIGLSIVSIVSLTMLAIATQKLVDSIKTDDDNDRSW